MVRLHHTAGAIQRDNPYSRSYEGTYDRPPFHVAGHSHFPIFFADNADFGPRRTKLLGSYEYRISIIDQRGNGWSIVAHFTVTS